MWGSIIGGALGFLGSQSQANATEEAAENAGAPWAGLQPYLTSGPIPEWLQTQMQPSNDWFSYVQGLNTGAPGMHMQSPPPMFGFQGMQPNQGWSPYDNPNAPTHALAGNPVSTPAGDPGSAGPAAPPPRQDPNNPDYFMYW